MSANARQKQEKPHHGLLGSRKSKRCLVCLRGFLGEGDMLGSVLGQKPPGHKPPDKNPLDKNPPDKKPPDKNPPDKTFFSEIL